MRSTPISYAFAIAAALSVSTAGIAHAQNRGTPVPAPYNPLTPVVPGAGRAPTTPPPARVTPTRTPTPQTSSPAGQPVPNAGSITVADGSGAAPASASTNATGNSDWIQQLAALQYSSALYNSIAQSASQLPPGSDPNVVASQMASAQQTAVANWFNNGAAATSVPAADSKGGAYFSNGAAATSVPTDQGQSSWYTNGASVTSVPTGDQRGASYFSNGGQATSVPNSVPPVPPPAPTQNQSVIPPAGVSTMPVVVDPNAAPIMQDDAVVPSDQQQGAPAPAAAPVDTSTTTTGAIVPAGDQAANGGQPGNVQNTVIATAVATTPGATSPATSPATDVASGSVGNATPRWQGGMLDDSQAPSSDAVKRPFMGFRILVALFGLAVMVSLVIGRMIARRSRQQSGTARSLV